MTQQLLLLQDQTPPDKDICARRHKGSPESTGANKRIAPLKEGLRRKVYVFISLFGPQGASCEDVERGLGLKHQTASARVSELRRDGWIASVGRGKTSSGAGCTLFRALTPAERKERGYEGGMQ